MDQKREDELLRLYAQREDLKREVEFLKESLKSIFDIQKTQTKEDIKQKNKQIKMLSQFIETIKKQIVI